MIQLDLPVLTSLDELHESELLDVRRRVLGAVIKLVIYQVVDMRYAVPIFAECLNVS
jgi:hypothetical protein